MKKIFIIDASNYIYRSYYAIKGMSTSKGISTNGLYGFIRSILNIKNDFNPDYMAVVFDGPKNKASRLAIYPEYKSHREKAPDDLYPQISLAKEFCKVSNLPIIEIDGVEADDGMGTVANFAKTKGLTSYLCSSDKDLCQLIDDTTFVLYTYKDNFVLTKEEVFKKYGVHPQQFIDYLAIVGDTSDNIPGIKGMGPKTAEKLLFEFKTLENLLKNTNIIPNKKQGEKIDSERKNAEISYRLATIDINLDIPKDLSFYQVKEADTSALKSFYQLMEFKTLLKELSPVSSACNHPQESNFVLIDDEIELKELTKILIKEKSLCIHLIPTFLNTKEGDIVGIGFGYKEGFSYYIPFNGKMSHQVILAILCPLFNGTITFYGHNIKSSMHFLSKIGLEIKNVDFDTLLASYILNSHILNHSLDFLIKKHFDVEIIAFKDILPASKDKTFKDVPLDLASNYCCLNINSIIKLKLLFKEQLQNKHFEKLYYDIELPLLSILFSMEMHGIYIDTTYLEKYSHELAKKLQNISEKIYSIANKEFNINSPKQLSSVLFDELGIKSLKETKTSHSTASEVLEALENEHPIIPFIQEYRTYEKLRSTYVDALPKEVNDFTKRIHCTFNQSGTVTGRLSSSYPNLQNIPVRGEEGMKVRKAFMPQKEGWVFLSLDYSQIELRILAHMSNEKVLIDAFNSDKDIHTITAAGVFNVPYELVTKDMRHKAKAVNFGILYGQKSFGLAKELKISVSAAKDIIDTYFKTYPKVRDFIDFLILQAKKEKKTTTLLGRERLLPDIDSSNFSIKAANERFAVNAPIQGSQADIIKIAMIDADKKILSHKLKSYLVLQIHDELIFECPENEISICEKIVKEAMEGAYLLSVPLKVDVSIGKNWSQC